jgi:hypothetical protein
LFKAISQASRNPSTMTLFEGNGGAARCVVRATFDRWRLQATVVVEPRDQATSINGVNVLVSDYLRTTAKVPGDACLLWSFSKVEL